MRESERVVVAASLTTESGDAIAAAEKRLAVNVLVASG
jgi:hypothetical protein